MSLSRQIAEVKGWTINPDKGTFPEDEQQPYWQDSKGEYVIAEDHYSPETNKAQNMDLLIELIDKLGMHKAFSLIEDQFDTSDDYLVFICLAWLSAFEGE